VKKKSSKKTGDALKEAAREIGSRLGEVHVKASRVVEGVKAAVKASTETYTKKKKTTKSKGKTKRTPRS